jgi:hypothetical protein
MTRNNKKNRKTKRKTKKQKIWTGGVRINEDYTRQHGRKTREECMQYFMENATFKLLTNSSRSCITLIANYHAPLSPFKSMRSNHLDYNVKTILVKILLTNPNNNRSWHTTKYRRGNYDGIAITPIQEFRQEIKTQVDIYRKSFVSQTSLLDPICPAVLFFQDRISNFEFSKYLAYFNTYDRRTYVALRDIQLGTDLPGIQLSAIYMEYMENYELVDDIFNFRIKKKNGIQTRELIQNPTETSQEQYKSFIKIIQYELFKLNQLGYHHNDAHLANIMINRQYPYFASHETRGPILHGKVILIDFGEVQKILPNINKYQMFLQEKFMEWVPTDLIITPEEIRQYDEYRVNYIIGVSGKYILDTFNIRNKTLPDLVEFMSNQEQFVTRIGGSVSVSRPKDPIYRVIDHKDTFGKKTKKTISKEEEKSGEEKLVKLLEDNYYDKELEALLEVEPEEPTKQKSKSNK